MNVKYTSFASSPVATALRKISSFSDTTSYGTFMRRNLGLLWDFQESGKSHWRHDRMTLSTSFWWKQGPIFWQLRLVRVCVQRYKLSPKQRFISIQPNKCQQKTIPETNRSATRLMEQRQIEYDRKKEKKELRNKDNVPTLTIDKRRKHKEIRPTRENLGGIWSKIKSRIRCWSLANRNTCDYFVLGIIPPDLIRESQ